MSVLLITHDLGVVAGRADRVAVMYAGQIVENRRHPDALPFPGHPYTRALFASMPRLDHAASDSSRFRFRAPSGAWPSGCRFHQRCPEMLQRCPSDVPRSSGSPTAAARAAGWWRTTPHEHNAGGSRPRRALSRKVPGFSGGARTIYAVNGSRSKSTRVKRSHWSANRAPGSRASAARCCGSTRQPPASVTFRRPGPPGS
jgi:oligopeptide/dipeptide ABC transporter ATP-binding protein